MLTTNDIQQLLQLITSDRVTIKGNEASGLVELQGKLTEALREAARAKAELSKEQP